MITTRTLDNGIRVIMEEMPQVQSIAIGFWVRTGAIDETPKYAGISHFVEHMMFKGTENRSAKQISGDIEKIGASMNAFTGKEATCYYVKSVAENYRPAADVIIDMLEHSLFEKKELDRERRVICEEIKMGEDQPDDLAHDKFVTSLFRGEKLSNSITGTRGSLERITHNVMKKYVEDQYTRDSMVISVAGRFDPDDVCEFFSGRFQSLKAKKPGLVQEKSEYVPAVHVVKKDIQQSHLCLGTRAITLDDERSYAFQIMNSILGGGMSSRLFQNIREERGLAYSVYSSLGAFSHDGYFEIYAGIAHDSLRAAIEGIREEIEKLADEPVSQEELDSSREQLKSGYVFSQESTSARMIINGKNYLLLGRTFLPEEVLASYDKVTGEEIEQVKSMITDFDSYTASLVTNRRADLKSMMRN